MKSTSIKLGAGLFGALILFGCGDDAAENTAEKIAEKAAESAGGGDVDIDIDSDGGKVKVKSKEGEFTAGTGGDLPDWVTDDIPVPDGAKVVSTVEVEEGRSVTLSAKGKPKDVFEKFKSDLAAKGIDLSSEPTTMESGGVSMYMLEFADKNGKVTVTFTNGDGDTIITMLLADITTGE